MTSPPPDVGEVEPIDHIGWVMDSILYSVEQTFDSFGIELPELRYLTLGTPSHDCEQVTVTFIQGYVGPPGDQAEGPQPCNGPRTASFQVEVVRTVPAIVGNLRKGDTKPDPAAMAEYTHNRGKDLWALLDSSKILNDYNAVIADVSVSEPMGAFQATVLNLAIQL